MKVSVLTPIYRTDERILREAIESVLGQTFTDFEFLRTVLRRISRRFWTW